MTLTKKHLILLHMLKKTDYNAKVTEIEGKIPRKKLDFIKYNFSLLCVKDE